MKNNQEIVFPVNLQGGEMFDRISIIIIKIDCLELCKSLDLIYQLEELQEIVNKTIGYDLARKIFNSNEYKELFSINKELFYIFDSMNKGKEISSIEVNKMNYFRFLKKKALQERFFKDELKEKKIGYND